MNGSGFDWLNMSGIDTHTLENSPAPPVLFGVSSDARSSPSYEEKERETVNNLNGTSTSSLSFSNQKSEGVVEIVSDTDENIPLSLTSFDLTPKEAKTYIRWYNNIISKKGTKTITLQDVFTFLNNFRLNIEVKDQLKKIFLHHSSSLNIGQFFALLRLISHSINGQSLERRLIKLEAPIPIPVPILSKKRQSETDTDDDDLPSSTEEKSNPFSMSGADAKKKLDLDGFTQFMLTGKRPQKKKLKGKRVKFSDQIVTGIAEEPKQAVPDVKLDMSLPMDQLLGKVPPQRGVTVPPSSNEEDEEEELKDMQESISHFQNVNIDSVSIHGVPSNIPPVYFNGTSLESPDSSLDSRSSTPDPLNNNKIQALRPNMTGPAQMSQMFSNSNSTGVPSLSMKDPLNHINPPRLSPTLTGSVPRSSSLLTPPVPPKSRNRSSSSPIPYNAPIIQPNNSRVPSPLAYTHPTQPLYTPPPPPPSRGRSSSGVAPPPPPSRRRVASSDFIQPPPLPPKISIKSNHSDSTLQHNLLQNNGFENHSIANGAPLSSMHNDSTADILGDLKVLEEELERIKAMTGSF